MKFSLFEALCGFAYGSIIGSIIIGSFWLNPFLGIATLILGLVSISWIDGFFAPYRR